MPEVLKNEKGEMDITKVLMAFGAMLVLVLQQWQSYRIAEIQATAKANKESFMPRKEVNEHVRRLEANYMPKSEIKALAKDLDDKLNFIQDTLNKGK